MLDDIVSTIAEEALDTLSDREKKKDKRKTSAIDLLLSLAILAAIVTFVYVLFY